MWELNWSMNAKLSYLAGFSTVDYYLLREDDELLELIKGGCYANTALEYINENY
jgi:hypothetical protein